MKEKRIPRIVVTGTNSGCGKTTTTLAILSALVRRGLRVQPFKVGPDYIDHKFHSAVAGRDSRNLDSWLCGERVVRELFDRHAVDADIAVVEGVMGLYDGYGGTELTGSTHDVAGIIDSPLILVVGARGMSLSACAMIEGYRRFGGYKRVGVILNGIAGESSYQMLCGNLREHLGEAVVPLGYLPRNPEFQLPERHLGLSVIGQSEEERRPFREVMERLGEQAESTLDVDGILAFATGRSSRASQAPESSTSSQDVAAAELKRARADRTVRLGVAYDDAFHFYYPDNFDLLKEAGAELVFFSPLADRKLPDVDGLYLGGGYPELYAEALEANASIRESIRDAAAAGMPMYAECGGLMYLSKSIQPLEQRAFAMCGVLDLETRMTRKLARFGYAEATLRRDSVLGEAGTAFRGHEFHYSEICGGASEPEWYDVKKRRRGTDGEWKEKTWTEGYGTDDGQVLASYLHIHFGTNQKLAANFVERCRKWRTR